jgi:hypothetical protein
VTLQVLVSTQQALSKARRRQAEQNRSASNALKTGRRLWRQVNPDSLVDSWARLVPQLYTVIAAAQLLAGRSADDYVTAVLDDQGIDSASAGPVNPNGLVGLSADGRDLMTTLMWPAWAAITALVAGQSIGRARAVGLAAADITTATQVQDAYRTAASIAAATRKATTTWTRALTGSGSCSRCIILAGTSSWSTAFQRHPRCDCTAIPSNRAKASEVATDPNKVFESLSKEEQDRIFGKGGAQAIRDGADMNAIVNARRKSAGISSAASNQLGLIREQGILEEIQGLNGNPRVTFSRTIAQNRRDKRVRVMPETIYRVARDRDHAIELLKANGFIQEDFRDRLMRVRGFV